jgi:hypothetical protein
MDGGGDYARGTARWKEAGDGEMEIANWKWKTAKCKF